MRQSIIAAGAALLLGAAVTIAQPPAGQQQRAPRDSARVEGDRRGPGGRGGPEGMLLRGITLSDAQRQRVDALCGAQRQRPAGSRDAGRTAFDEIRTLRQRGDTAAANARLRDLRARMERDRDQRIAALRGVLTKDQQARFDANVAEMKQRMAERGQRAPGARGDRDGRGDRRDRRGHDDGARRA